MFFLAALLFPRAAPAAPPVPPPSARFSGRSAQFVTRDGPHFVLGGRRFRFFGANLDVVHGPGARATYRQTLAAAARDGFTVGRVWALGSAPAGAPPGVRADALWIGGATLNEDLARHLDHVLAAAARDRLHLVVVLENRWDDYGGVPSDLRALGLPADDAATFGATDDFYASRAARALYLSRLDTLLERRNTVTGVLWKDDPTILSFELLNESDVADAAGAAARLDFLDTVARHLHAVDPHHLVSAGVWGYRSPRSRAWWLAACELPSIDYCDAHLYPAEDPAITGPADLRAAIDDRVAAAHVDAGKPIVIGEIGFGSSFAGTGVAAEVRTVAGELARDGADGALVWIYGPWNGAPRGDGYGIYTSTYIKDASPPPSQRALRAALRLAARRLERAPDGPANPRLRRYHAGDPPLFDETEHIVGGGDVPVPPPSVRTGTLVSNRRWSEAPTSLPPPRVTRAKAAASMPASRPTAWPAGGGPLALPLADFANAVFERAGFGTKHGTQLFGGGAGHVDFPLPPAPPGEATVTVTARLSSEYPGSVAPEDGFSRVVLSLDGAPLATVLAMPDDGHGREVTFTGARVVLAGKAPHTLTFTVPPGPLANGLCLYGPTIEVALARTARAP